MPEIDLDPKDYSAQPLKGEKVFAAGGLQRILLFLALICFVVLMNAFVKEPYLSALDWLLSLL